jgi:hypothetical protein
MPFIVRRSATVDRSSLALFGRFFGRPPPEREEPLIMPASKNLHRFSRSLWWSRTPASPNELTFPAMIVFVRVGHKTGSQKSDRDHEAQ